VKLSYLLSYVVVFRPVVLSILVLLVEAFRSYCPSQN